MRPYLPLCGKQERCLIEGVRPDISVLGKALSGVVQFASAVLGDNTVSPLQRKTLQFSLSTNRHAMLFRAGDAHNWQGPTRKHIRRKPCCSTCSPGSSASHCGREPSGKFIQAGAAFEA